MTQSPDVYADLHADPEFHALRKAFRGFVFPVTVAFLVWYLLYVVMSAFSLEQVTVDGKTANVMTGLGEFLDRPVFGDNINVAFVFGILQFVSTFLIAFLYGRFARRKLDPLAESLRQKVAARGHDVVSIDHLLPDGVPNAAAGTAEDKPKEARR